MKFLQKIIIGLSLLGILESELFASAGKGGPKIGDVPPPLILSETIQGPSAKEIKWDKLKGKVVVLEFWNTRCGPCVQAIPHWNELINQFSNKSVVFISVTDDNPTSLKNFLKFKPMKGWMAIDGPLTASRTAFEVHGIPHTVLVDKVGKIAAITHPALLMAKHLDELLSDKPSSLPAPKKMEEDDVVSVSTPTQNIFQISISGPFPQPTGAFNFSRMG